MIDFKALKGDTTDNIPGLAGSATRPPPSCWRTTARWTACSTHVDEVKPDKLRDKLVANKDDVLLWRAW